MSLKGKTLFITGGSRGIGLAIALKAARDGANVAIAAKTVDPHPKLEGTIHTAAAEIEKAGGARSVPRGRRDEIGCADDPGRQAVERLDAERQTFADLGLDAIDGLPRRAAEAHALEHEACRAHKERRQHAGDGNTREGTTAVERDACGYHAEAQDTRVL